MTQRFLNVRDPVQVADFIDSVVEYLPESEQAEYAKFVAKLHQEEEVTPEEMSEQAKGIALKTWPIRRALDKYLQGAGAEKEWEAVLDAVRPTTALLLKRLWKNSGLRTLDEALASSDAPLAIHDSEEMEIKLVRPEVRISIWEEEQETLKPLLKEAMGELEALQKRLKILREQAMRVAKQQEALLARLEGLEDRIYFAGESPSLEKLDAEMQYALEESIIPSEEGVFG
jgi:chromosome segregation ATPase